MLYISLGGGGQPSTKKFSLTNCVVFGIIRPLLQIFPIPKLRNVANTNGGGLFCSCEALEVLSKGPRAFSPDFGPPVVRSPSKNLEMDCYTPEFELVPSEVFVVGSPARPGVFICETKGYCSFHRVTVRAGDSLILHANFLIGHRFQRILSGIVPLILPVSQHSNLLLLFPG